MYGLGGGGGSWLLFALLGALLLLIPGRRRRALLRLGVSLRLLLPFLEPAQLLPHVPHRPRDPRRQQALCALRRARPVHRLLDGLPDHVAQLPRGVLGDAHLELAALP